MNYASYPDFESLLSMATRGVKEEWLVEKRDGAIRETKFLSEFTASLRHVYASSKMAGATNFLPAPEHVLEPFKYIRPRDVHVIITAQDPYPNARDACGIAFQSFAPRCPTSAKNINASLIKYGHIEEKYADVSDYRSWLAQGVLLTNVSLTTKEGTSRAHGAVWKGVIQFALQLVPRESVAVLLGQDARAIMTTLNSVHKVEHVHPVSRNNEFGDKDVFGEVNACLAKMNLPLVNWRPGPGPAPARD